MDVLGVFSKKIEDITSQRDVNTILLIGSGVDAYRENLDKVRDIDLFVLYDNDNYSFEREVVNYNGVEFDISHISLRDLERGIREKWPFIIISLHKYRYVYKKDDRADKLLREIKLLYNNGPRKLDKIEIDSLRFEIDQYLSEIRVRKNDRFNYIFLANNLFKKVLIAYFILNELWIPKDKKILKTLMDRDIKLYDLALLFIREEDLSKKIKVLEDIIEYVLTPFGGTLKEWKKGPFPLGNGIYHNKL